MTDHRVLEELLTLKDETIRVKNKAFSRLTSELLNRLCHIEFVMEEKSFFPAAVLKEVRDLKHLIKIAR